VRKIQRSAISFLLFQGLASVAQAGTINFDDVGSGTVINNHYAGVTFTKLLNGVDGGNVFANGAFPNTAESPANVVSVFGTTYPGFDNRYGTIHAAFDEAQATVSVDVLLRLSPEGYGSSGTGYMKVYDSSNKLLDTLTTTTLNSWQTLSYTGVDIKNVYFTVQYSGQHATYGTFDNFSSAPVPEPETYAMLLAGLGLMASINRRRRHCAFL
jgi:hypothetical protein